jgi:uncharacterized membrane protein
VRRQHVCKRIEATCKTTFTKTEIMNTSDPYKPLIVPAITALIFAILLAGVIGGMYAWRFHDMKVIADPANWGVLGDYFGGTLGPIFNLITIFLLVTSMRLQHKQIKDAKEDGDEAKLQVQADHRAIVTQSFEQTLFSWLRGYREIVNGIRFDQWSGRKALSTMWDIEMNSNAISGVASIRNVGTEIEIYRKIEELLNNIGGDREDLDISTIIAINYAFDAMYNKHVNDLDTMFRTLYRLIRWIDESKMSPMEKFNYVGIARSQISAIELHYIFLNSLTERGKKFRNLINKYALLDNMEFSNQLFEKLRTHGSGCGSILDESAFDADVARARL